MTVKKRSVALAILFSIITCGIYAIYWQVSMVNSVNAVSKKENAKGGVVVFLLSLITCSIYWLYWIFKAGDTIDAAKTAKGIPTSNRGLVYLLLSIFGLGLVAFAIMQSDLNSLAETPNDNATAENAIETEKDNNSEM